MFSKRKWKGGYGRAYLFIYSCNHFIYLIRLLEGEGLLSSKSCFFKGR
ncbi:hypothetical protein HMPREF3191_01301 [Veillonellaceae bacterium DNF00626]|nr:hypothetical protein HMPREF3191_01301 [Veillonellaceae bacterium DNF00626]